MRHLGKSLGKARHWQPVHSKQVQHCAEDLVQVYGSGLGFAPHRLKQGRDLQELVAGEVTGVLFTAHPGIVGQNY